MKDQYQDVPLKHEESVLPVYRVAGPQFAFASINIDGGRYQDVRLDDSSQYQVVPMRWRDEAATNSLFDEE